MADATVETPAVNPLVAELTKATALVAELTAKHAATESRMNALEAKANRPAFTAGMDEKDKKEVEAFGLWVKGGDAALRTKGIDITTDANGKVAVPKTIASSILEVATAYAPVRKLARVETCTSEDFSIIVSKSNASFGWVLDTGTRAATDPAALAAIKPIWGEGYTNVAATNRSLNDLAFNVEGFVVKEAGKALGLGEDLGFLLGTGADGQPKGLLTYTIAASPSFGQIKQIKSGVSGTLGSDPYGFLLSLTFAIRAAYRMGACWLMNPATLATIRGVKDSQGRPLFYETNVPAADGSSGSILGYKVYEDENVAVAGAASNSIVFGNLSSALLVADISDSLGMVRDPYTVKGQTLFYVSRRVGSCIADSTSVAVGTLSA